MPLKIFTHHNVRILLTTERFLVTTVNNLNNNPTAFTIQPNIFMNEDKNKTIELSQLYEEFTPATADNYSVVYRLKLTASMLR
jgi:hypothetical protein